MFKLRGKFSIIIFYAFLGLFFYTNISQAAYQDPSFNPVSDNALNASIYNDLGDNSIYILNNPFGIGGSLTVGNNNLFVDVNLNRVGIGTDTPKASLDVNGIVRIPTDHLANFPTCTSSLAGTFMFNLDQDRLNICFNGAWRRIGYDGDLDGWLDYRDCDDNDPNLNPGSEVCGDMVSNDCDDLVNEGCSCTASEFTPLPACPDMSSCDSDIFIPATKLTDCTGGLPSFDHLFCPCICRPEHFTSPIPPVCPVCRVIDITVHAIPWADCIDENSLGSTFCPANCSTQCQGSVCCSQPTYSECSFGRKVYHDACGVAIYTDCEYGCVWGACLDGWP